MTKVKYKVINTKEKLSIIKPVTPEELEDEILEAVKEAKPEPIDTTIWKQLRLRDLSGQKTCRVCGRRLMIEQYTNKSDTCKDCE